MFKKCGVLWVRIPPERGTCSSFLFGKVAAFGVLRYYALFVLPCLLLSFFILISHSHLSLKHVLLCSTDTEARSAMIGVDLLTRDDRGLFALEKDSTTLSRFLNRILGLPVRLQNQLFAYFTDTLAALIKQAKRAGSWDGGIRGRGWEKVCR